MSVLRNLAMGSVFCIAMGCATTPPAGSCNPADAWVAGKQGKNAATGCLSLENRMWREAYNLGRQLNTFELQLQNLDHELASLAGGIDAAARRGQLKLQRIKLTREIESISGVASVRGWGKQVQVDAPE